MPPVFHVFSVKGVTKTFLENNHHQQRTPVVSLHSNSRQCLNIQESPRHAPVPAFLSLTTPNMRGWSTVQRC